jgi:hypothetical protein
MPAYPIYPGNCPANVSKDAKYTVRSGKGGPVVAIIYEAEEDERWHPTTDSHPQLVKMVNDVKMAHAGKPNGNFYINEYKHVIVPVVGSSAYYFAGVYDRPLRFDFEGKTISGEPLDLNGNVIAPGQTWTGPHAGIPYVLASGGTDVYYECTPRPNVTKKVRLSKAIGVEQAKQATAPIRAIRGVDGGRFYVNEFGSIFTPSETAAGWQYMYVGEIVLNLWFAPPAVGTATA